MGTPAPGLWGMHAPGLYDRMGVRARRRLAYMIACAWRVCVVCVLYDYMDICMYERLPLCVLCVLCCALVCVVCFVRVCC